MSDPVQLPNDVWLSILNELSDDKATLCQMGLVCKAWREVSFPALLRDVDISFHDRTGIPEGTPEKELWNGMWLDEIHQAPDDFLDRQSAFIRLLAAKPELASQVKRFKWTLMWRELEHQFCDAENHTLDLQTWAIFTLLTAVTNLDLSSLHILGQPSDAYVRENPATLFPAVTHLRLSGWMHRGLVAALIHSLDKTRLVSLSLDKLHDEGSLYDGRLMPSRLAASHAHSMDRGFYDTEYIDDALAARQEESKASIFPGPMWFPLRKLSDSSVCLLLTKLEYGFVPFQKELEIRSYHTTFAELGKLVRKVSSTLVVLTVNVREWIYFHPDARNNNRYRCVHLNWKYGRSCFDLTVSLLEHLHAAFYQHDYPRLRRVQLRGFSILGHGKPLIKHHDAARNVLQALHQLPYIDDAFEAQHNIDFASPHVYGDNDAHHADENEVFFSVLDVS